MKKHLIVLSILVYVLLSSFLVNSLNENLLLTTASTENSTLYAKVEKDCYLLKTPTKILNYTNAYFILEESYFVVILNNLDNYYYVQYQDIKGYVEKENLIVVNEQIENPFLEDITFNITKDTYLYEEPLLNSNLIKTPLTSLKTPTYIGKIYSDEISDVSGNVWYFAKINNNGVEIKGYVHSSFTNNLTPITQNNSVSTEYISNNIESTLLNINQTTQIIIIFIISMPTLFILYLLLKGFKKV